MCIVLCSIGKSTEFPFILISNRDEYFIRKTLKLCVRNEVLSPYDLARPDGGTWIGLNISNGAVCCLVNFRELGQFISVKSRGKLPLVYLSESIDEFENYYRDNVKDIGAFSFLYGNLLNLGGDFNIISNRSQMETFGEGSIVGLSNSQFTKPWPKVIKAKRLLKELLEKDIKDKDELIDNLFEILSVNDMSTRSMESLQESIYIPPIKTPKTDGNFFGEYYGTRTQTIIITDKYGVATYLEKTLYDEDNLQRKDHIEKFVINYKIS